MTATATPLPPDLEPVRQAALRAIAPIKAATESTVADETFLFNAKRTEAGRTLPPYYLVYFLLVELLGFRNLGKFEKVSWSVPIEFQGRAFLIEHRKFGLGVFAHDPANEEDAAKEIVSRIQRAVREAEPFFEWLAEKAAANSKLNVINNNVFLFERFRFLSADYVRRKQEAHDRRDERIIKEGETMGGGKWQTITMPAHRLRVESGWIALSAVDAFFSWTEHVFILVAILRGDLKTGTDVVCLAEADWATKFKAVFDLNDPASKKFYDSLVSIRQELRNYVAHGAFGKQGQAFDFHSRAGAVPLLLPHRAGSKFRFGQGMSFDYDAALEVIEKFVPHLWSGTRAPAQVYVQTELPLILTHAADGTYAAAMSSSEAMEELVDYLSHQFDQAANMDW